LVEQMKSFPVEDLDAVVDDVVWDDLRGGRVFLTGTTGFFGAWLLQTLLRANERHALGVRIVVLARSAASFRARFGDVADIVQRDVRNRFHIGEVSHAIHAATSTTDREVPRIVATIVDGMRNVIEAIGGARLLFTSSGAVYGRQPPELTHVPEEHLGGPDPMLPANAYGESKRLAELLCAAHGAVVARGFAFVGPGLPLDAHFAIGNFIRDALAERTIVVQGDGTPFRSYLYASDLTTWLWTLLLRGEGGRAYNVGSEAAVSIVELAQTVGRIFGREVEIRGVASGAPAERYVPATARARGLGLREKIALDDAIDKTARYYRAT
jgi:dTDP-glucose 4,6-dehydratase